MISSFEQINFNSKYVDKKAFILGLRLPKLILRSYPVEVISLSSFITQIKLTRDIDIIKIDTEGHEYYCLSGLFSECLSIKINHIQPEQHFNDQYQNSIGFKHVHVHRILKSNGFYLQKKITNCYGDFNEFIYSSL
ncbi:hypothetical protein Dfri01_50730 [Dyadobacter frigoris]|nr:hypothetical protein Dfri01_50730 [Dyadobacter frigoris]